ncbi:hypothetical protein BIY24_12175 [Halobacteriovorax marinus]|uniref:hypothetical protein n=1 Tax=Halobacteriovorax marinus TaxID=97084 RepID=UPI0005CAF903|nr:hypothetical protein [Halobacteriovorax marinus]ATH08676.1 hypothetical protein BIY24_12175 [Halobacteriovorax marinus]
MTNLDNNTQVIHLIIRVPKADAAFTYFQLEANEGLCFYSTLEDSLRESYRDITIKAHQSLESEMRSVLDTLSKNVSFEVLLDETKEDSL